MPDESLIAFGGQLKSLGGNKVGGYAVVFGGHDVVHDRFLPTTDYDLFEGKSVPVLFDHGLDEVLKKRRFGRATLKADDVGLWFESILEQRDEYEKQIFALIEAGKLGLSSGSAPHLVERKSVGDVDEITAWPVVEVSYTHRPAEIRTTIISLKSYQAILDDRPFILDGSSQPHSLAPLPERAAHSLVTHETARLYETLARYRVAHTQ